MAIYRCKAPFSTRVNGVPRVVASGDLVDDTDPVFKGRERLFEVVDTYVDRIAKKRSRVPALERATDEPGVKRTLDTPERPRRRSSGKTKDKAQEETP